MKDSSLIFTYPQEKIGEHPTMVYVCLCVHVEDLKTHSEDQCFSPKPLYSCGSHNKMLPNQCFESTSSVELRKLYCSISQIQNLDHFTLSLRS